MAQTLQCREFTKNDGGVYGGANEVTVAKPGAPYQVAGGQCAFMPYVGHPGVPDPSMPFVIFEQGWINDQSLWACKAGPTGDYFVTTTATIFACQAVTNPVDTVPASLVAPTNIFAIARRGFGLAKTLYFDYRVCNVDATDGLNVGYFPSDANPDPSKPNIAYKTISPGSCMDLGLKSYLYVQASSQSGNRNVYYERFPAGTFAVQFPPPVSPAPNRPPSLLPPGVLPPGAQDWTATCAPIPQKSGAKGQAAFDLTCSVSGLPDWGHYRICFGAGFVELKDGTRTDWPYKLISTTLNDQPTANPVEPTDGTNPRFNAVDEPTCRDYYSVNSIGVLVGGAPPTWDATKVKAVHMSASSIQPIVD
jgi:hypothetical protein